MYFYWELCDSVKSIFTRVWQQICTCLSGQIKFEQISVINKKKKNKVNKSVNILLALLCDFDIHFQRIVAELMADYYGIQKSSTSFGHVKKKHLQNTSDYLLSSKKQSKQKIFKNNASQVCNNNVQQKINVSEEFKDT